MKIIIIFFLVLLLGFRPVLPFLEYGFDYEYISTVLCINKDKPKMQCNGKCYLKNKLAIASDEGQSKSEKNNNSTTTKLLSDFFPLENNYTNKMCSMSSVSKEKIDFKSTPYSFDFQFGLLKPPII